MLGFMRRFDDSYAEAKRRIDAGDIGKVVLVRSYTQDPRTTIEVRSSLHRTPAASIWICACMTST